MQKSGVEVDMHIYIFWNNVGVDIIAVNYITERENMLFFRMEKKLKICLNISDYINYSMFLCTKCGHHIADEW